MTVQLIDKPVLVSFRYSSVVTKYRTQEKFYRTIPGSIYVVLGVYIKSVDYSNWMQLDFVLLDPETELVGVGWAQNANEYTIDDGYRSFFKCVDIIR